MSRAATYAEWIVRNADKRGTPEFDVVARAYEEARRQEMTPATAAAATPAPQSRDMGDRIVGALEAGATMVSGSVAAPLGAAAGLAKGVGESILNGTFGTPEASRLVDQYAANATQAMTYAPRGEAGREYVGAIGEAMAPLAPAQGLMPQLAALGEAASLARPAAQASAQAGAQRAGQAAQQARQSVAGAVQSVTDSVGSALGRTPAADAAGKPRTFGGSVGAAGADMSLVRDTTADSLPVPVTLTQGAATRDPMLQQFEAGAIKTEAGAPLRERAELNNSQLLANFDAMVDMTGARAASVNSAGEAVVSALKEGYEAAKTKTNALYKKARQSDEASAIASPDTVVTIGSGDDAIQNSVVGYLNSRARGVPSAGVTDAARQQMLRLGLAVEDERGQLIARPATVAQMEEFRREVSGLAKWDDPSAIRQETILKKLIDATTEPVSGPLFREARAARAEQARKFENRAIVDQLIRNRRGMDDPRVAVERVFDNTVLRGSAEELTFLKRVLVTSGDNGKQAWRELQGQTIKWLRSEATKNSQTGEMSREVIAAKPLDTAIKRLDENGRLDLIFGKKDAQTLRDLNDVTKYVTTSAPNAILRNGGDAFMAVLAVAEAAAGGLLMGVPAPVLTTLKLSADYVKNARLKRRIQEALREEPQGRAARQAPPQSTGAPIF